MTEIDKKLKEQLLFCIKNDQDKIIEILLDRMPDLLTQRLDNGDNLLTHAARCGSPDVAALILEKAPELLTEPNEKGEFPIHATPEREICDGIRANDRISNRLNDGRAKVLNILLQSDGTIVSQINGSGKTPLQIAQSGLNKKCIEIIRSKLDNDPDIVQSNTNDVHSINHAERLEKNPTGISSTR